MGIVRYTNAKTGITYAYESKAVWDPEKKQARPVRTYLGRIDPETGEIISTKRQKKVLDEASPEYKKMAERNAALTEEKQSLYHSLNELKIRVASLESENTKLRKLVKEINQMTAE